MNEFHRIQELNGGGLPPSQEELHTILYQVYIHQTNKQHTPQDFFAAIVKELYDNFDRGGPGELTNDRLIDNIANYSSTVPSQVLKDAQEPASPQQYSMIQTLMSEFNRGQCLSPEEQDSYNVKLENIMPKFKAMFSADGHFEGFEHHTVIKHTKTTTEHVVQNEVENVNYEPGNVDEPLPTNQHDSKYKAPDAVSDESQLADLNRENTSVENPIHTEPVHTNNSKDKQDQVTTWEDIFYRKQGVHTNEQTHQEVHYSVNTPVITQAPTAVNTRYEDSQPNRMLSETGPTYSNLEALIDPTTKLEYHLGISIRDIPVESPSIDQFKFSHKPSIQRAEHIFKPTESKIHVPSFENSIHYHPECIILNDSQVLFYISWRAEHPTDSFEQFMEYLRHSELNGPNLRSLRESRIEISAQKSLQGNNDNSAHHMLNGKNHQQGTNNTLNTHPFDAKPRFVSQIMTNRTDGSGKIVTAATNKYPQHAPEKFTGTDSLENTHVNNTQQIYGAQQVITTPTQIHQGYPSVQNQIKTDRQAQTGAILNDTYPQSGYLVMPKSTKVVSQAATPINSARLTNPPHRTITQEHSHTQYKAHQQPIQVTPVSIPQQYNQTFTQYQQTNQGENSQKATVVQQEQRTSNQQPSNNPIQVQNAPSTQQTTYTTQHTPGTYPAQNSHTGAASQPSTVQPAQVRQLQHPTQTTNQGQQPSTQPQSHTAHHQPQYQQTHTQTTTSNGVYAPQNSPNGVTSHPAAAQLVQIRADQQPPTRTLQANDRTTVTLTKDSHRQVTVVEQHQVQGQQPSVNSRTLTDHHHDLQTRVVDGPYAHTAFTTHKY